MKRRCQCLMLVAALTATVLGGCGDSGSGHTELSEAEQAAWDAAANDPYGKYPELVTYTCGYNLTNQGDNLIVLKQVFTYSKVIKLNFALCFFNGTGKHFMLNLLSVRNA